MFRNRSANVHQFSMVPRAEIPRSTFRIQHSHKTTFDAGYLVPIFVDEVLPGDSFKLSATLFARLSTPINPIMDNLHLETFFFFVPNRLVWSNWVRLMGEQPNPGDSTDFLVPQVTSEVGGAFPVGGVADHFGLPTVGQAAAQCSASALPFRAYNLIWNEWFRDENLQTRAVVNTNDAAESVTNFPLRRRGKRHDYFTSCLPWPQKGDSVELPLGTSAPVVSQFNNGLGGIFTAAVGPPSTHPVGAVTAAAGGALQVNAVSSFYSPNGTLFADLSQATSATINQLRQAFQIQKLLERDARGGTRYTELVRSHFGVLSPDARLQRPEYLGGGSSGVNINPIAQTQRTDADATPLGTLGAMGTALAPGHGFRQSFTEHGVIIGLASVRADLTYQQGVRRMWSRRSRYDFYWPAFATIGEQAVLNKEIYFQGTQVDNEAFGYQERWSEYRHHPSLVTGLFRSTTAGTLDNWHLAQRFGSLPTLSDGFIQDVPPMERVLAVGAAALGKHFICDMFFDSLIARPMPVYSVPGLIDHF